MVYQPENSRRVLATSPAGASLTRPHPFTVRASHGQAHLRIMETTDLHVHVYPYDYYADRAVDTAGLARTAAHVTGLRAAAANTLLLDNGDFLQGNPMGDFIAYERGMKEGDAHPVITAMNTLGYDAATLGNHEFNYGLGFLLKSLAGAVFPVVSANVVKTERGDPTKDTTLVQPYAILDRVLSDGAGRSHPIRIGVIGFVPPQIMQWDACHLLGNVATRDIVATARAYVPRMREEGADIIIALSHSGIGVAEPKDMMENASTALGLVDGIDAILTGHSHLVFPGASYAGRAGIDLAGSTLHGTPAVMAGFWGSHLGVIDLMLERDAGTWRVVAHSVETRPIWKRNGDRSIDPLVESDPGVLASVAAVHAQTLAYVRRPVGRCAAPLHSYFALVAGDPTVRIVNQAQRWYVSQMLDGTRFAGLPILSAAAPFKAGGRGGAGYFTDVPAGDLAIRNVADLYLYPNTVQAVKVSGAELEDWLERSAGVFNRIQPGKADQFLLNPDFPSYNFDVIDGVTYQIDLSQPSRYTTDGKLADRGARRIVSLTHDGRPVTPEMEFVVATNNYRASGGGDFPGSRGDTVIFDAPDTNRDVVVRYIAEHGTIDPRADPAWSFVPLPGTSVLFDTGPGAARYLDKVPGVEIAPAGDGPDGLARYRIAL